MLFVPPADKAAPKTPALANTYAALTELAPLRRPANRYQTRFDANEAAGHRHRRAVRPRAPSSSCPQAPKRARPGPGRPGWPPGRCSSSCSPRPGGSTDEVRAAARRGPGRPRRPCQTFGLYRLTWPRAGAARRRHPAVRPAAAAAVDGEGGRPTSGSRSRQWLADQWAKQELDPPAVVGRFDAGRPGRPAGGPGGACSTPLVDPLRTRTPGSSAGPTRRPPARSSTSSSSWSASRTAEDDAPGSLDGVIRDDGQEAGRRGREQPGDAGRLVHRAAAVPAGRGRGGAGPDRRPAASGTIDDLEPDRPRPGPGGPRAVRPAVPR